MRCRSAITHHGVAADIDRENRCKLLETMANPLLPMFIVVASRGVNTAEKGPADAARDAMIHTDFAAGHDFETWVRGHRDVSRSRHWQTVDRFVRTFRGEHEYRIAPALSILPSAPAKKVGVCALSPRLQPAHRRGSRFDRPTGSAPGHARADHSSCRCRYRADRAAAHPLADPMIR
jgi:hypothetical protein